MRSSVLRFLQTIVLASLIASFAAPSIARADVPTGGASEVAAGVVGASRRDAAAKANIIFVLFDDMGLERIGSSGGTAATREKGTDMIALLSKP